MAAHTTAARQDTPKATLARFAALAASLFLVSLLIVTQSKAAFTATHTNSANGFSAATIALDDGTASAMFNASNMVPGDTQYACVTVTYTGGVDPSIVHVYSGSYTDTGLGSFLDLTIKEVGAGTCNGTLAGTIISAASSTIAGFSALTSYAAGVGAWDPATSGDSQRYQFIVTLTTAATNTEQGKSASAVPFTWETQAGA